MMEANEIKLFCRICSNGQKILNNAVKQLNLSARAYDKILKVSRTIADLDFSQEILPHHLAEAIQYRQLDRNK
jgi:magnesium chelatase family protein